MLPPRRLAIWDPAVLNDNEGRLALTALEKPDFAWDGLQIRDKHRQAKQPLLVRLAQAARARGMSLWINRDTHMAEQLAADGLVVGVNATASPWPTLVSIHNSHQCQLAMALKPTALLYGHILATPSKSMTAPRGWLALQQLAATINIPILALGGLSLADEPTARANGAYGIAAIRAAFKER